MCKENLETEECAEGCTCDEQINYSDVLILDTENVEDIVLDEEEFENGVFQVSETCGMISGLVAVGLTPTESLDFILNKMNIDFNLKSLEMNNATQIQIAQIQSVQIEQGRI